MIIEFSSKIQPASASSSHNAAKQLDREHIAVGAYNLKLPAS